MKKNSLSIVITTFNRCEKLKKLISSIVVPKSLNYEIIIINDGSEDDTRKFLDKYKRKKNFILINQENLGRSVSLMKGVKVASKEYTMIMDDDDYFLKSSLNYINKILGKKKSNFYIFNTKISKNEDNFYYLNKKKTNFLKLRADLKIKKDFKEIVNTKLIKNAFIKYSKIISNNRRIPTGLIWSEISKKNNSLFFSKKIIKKNYLIDGLTEKSSLLKFFYPIPMAAMYLNYIKNKNYNSYLQRIKYKILYIRYNFHSQRSVKIFSYKIFLTFVAFLIYLIDKVILEFKKK